MAVHFVRSVLLTLALATTSASLAGCTPTPPVPSPTSAPTAGSTPSSNTSGPSSASVTPSVASSSISTTSDDQRAIEAVQRYYAAFNKALTTLDTTEMRTLYQPGCIVCEQDAAQLEQMAREGKRITGGATTLDTFAVTVRSGELLGLRANAASEAITVRDRNGKVVAEEPAVTAGKNFTAVKVAGRWLLEGITK